MTLLLDADKSLRGALAKKAAAVGWTLEDYCLEVLMEAAWRNYQPPNSKPPETDGDFDSTIRTMFSPKVKP